ncbi:MAG TPA: DUF1501 domain-containing protein, partial [Bacteroidota bacterium]|nr:DUF1501 domain-containing protein [Bacteroidota bacterium]
GLNMVIPIDQYSALSNARSNILIDEATVLRLSDKTGLHPSMTGLMDLYTQGKLAVVQGVGYPNQNFSHFRSTDIWLTGSNYNETLTSGWLGRYLDKEYPAYPDGYPNATNPDPLAIQIGSILSTSIQGPTVGMGMAITSPTSFYQFLTGAVDPAPDTPAGHELTFIREVAQQTQMYAVSIKTAAAKVTTQSAYPPGNSLASQLKIVAQLIGGGLKTRLYVTNLGGFDTHDNQINRQQTLLSQLSAAIKAFQDDLKFLGAEDRVVGMTFSEFGRRIKSNANGGTDHGAAAPLFVFGKRVTPGIVGANPILPASATVNDNIPMQQDFRAVYSTILKNWFNVPDDELMSVMLNTFPTLPLINTTTGVAPNTVIPLSFTMSQNYPNPFNPTTHFQFSVASLQFVSIKVFDSVGREVATLVNETMMPGVYTTGWNGVDEPSGVYYCRINAGSYQATRKMVLQK